MFSKNINKQKINSNHKAFTLVEILIVVGIIAILFSAIVFVLNPVEVLKNSRDSQRLNDLSTLNRAINYIQANESNKFLGQNKVVYVSLPDESLSSGQTSTCSNFNLPSLPSGYSYQCVSKYDLKKNNGSGWLPIDFSNQPAFKISTLPIDPQNNIDYYYLYSFNPQNNKFEINARLESQKQQNKLIEDGGDSALLYEIGSDISLIPITGIGSSITLKNNLNNIIKNYTDGVIYIANAQTAGQIPYFIASDKVDGANMFWNAANGRLGIGISNPGSLLSVSGGVSIGSSYATQAAPTNGLIVEGNVGIGTNNPVYSLTINDSLGNNQFYVDTSSSTIAQVGISHNNESLLTILGAGRTGILLRKNPTAQTSRFFKRWSLSTFLTHNVYYDGTNYYLDLVGQDGWILRMADNVGGYSGFEIFFGPGGTSPFNPISYFKIDRNGRIGIGTSSPNSKLQVVDGDVAVSTQGSGIILRATDGANCFRLTVNNAGVLNTSPVACP
ncbi:MAG: type II secretion system GspH family protein [Patescibacteria group bacterium]|nr:type II secretion system GspH family protein [Patescibacteria group bacterium]